MSLLKLHSLALLFFSLAEVIDTVACSHFDQSSVRNGVFHVKRATQQELSDSQAELIRTRLAHNSGDSWVSGTRAEAILEFDTPELSVYSPTWTNYFTKKIPTRPSEVINIARSWQNKLNWDSPTFIGDQQGAAGDPCSIGVAFLWAAITDDNNNAYNYEHAMHKQKEFMQYTVPRLDDGTMSQRATWEPVQLWDDFVYMAPPYLALYGVYFGNEDMIQEAYDQCRLYRRHMRDSSTKLWKHVLLGDWQDDKYWGTGMGWAAAGMARVAATLKNSKYASQYSTEIKNLNNWAMEIVKATSSAMDSGLLPNQYETSSTFRDASSSAMIASTIYRLAAMNVSGASSYISQANRIRRTVYRGISSKTGWNSPVTDPLDWYTEIHKSPEAIAFILIMEAAWRDYQDC